MKYSIELLFLLNVCLFAHPHMFIDTEMEVRLSNDNLEGIEITWHFDPMFTAAICADFDTNGNDHFNNEETASVFSNAFSNLQSSEYFTFVNIDGQVYSPERIEEFSVFVEDGALAYRFFCPFNIAIPEGVFRVAIYDSTFYCDILYKEGLPITITGPGNETAQFEIEQNSDISISYGGNVSVSRDGGSYSGTAFPQQLVVYLNCN